MSVVTTVNAFLDRKPFGNDLLANALRARGQRISNDVCVLENVIYCRTEKGLRAQYLTDSRTSASVSGVPGTLQTNVWYEFDDRLKITVGLNEIVVPNHDFLIKIFESDYCIYRVDKDEIYLNAISNGACARIEIASRANGFTPVYNKIYEPIYTGTMGHYPGLVWALESAMSLQRLEYSRGLFDGIASAYCALTGARISADYFDRSFIVTTSTSKIEHKCSRPERGNS